MLFDFANVDQGLLYWVLVAGFSLLSVVLVFLFFYWMIRLAVFHGMRSYLRFERSGRL